jgi:hypothetical protein
MSSDELASFIRFVLAMAMSVATGFFAYQYGRRTHASCKAGLPNFSLLELQRLLLSLFRADELRRFLHLYFGDEGQALVQALPPAVLSEEAQMFEVLVALQQRGLLDAAFFDALAAERPRRVADIRRVQNGGAAVERRAA